MISVVTLTYNNYEDLIKTVQSVAGLAIEHIVINGGECLKTRKFLETFSGIAISEPDQGISDGFNKGWSRSSGQAIAFLNSGDELLEPTYYSRAEKLLLDQPAVSFVYGDLRFDHSKRGARRMMPRGKGLSDLGKGLPFPHLSMVVRRQVFDQIGGFSQDYRIAMDYDWVTRLLLAGYQGHYLPLESVLMDGSGVSSRREWEGIQECQRSLIGHGLYHGKIRRDYWERVVRYRLRAALGL
jgi:GT2 family glycosyltransferase